MGKKNKKKKKKKFNKAHILQATQNAGQPQKHSPVVSDNQNNQKTSHSPAVTMSMDSKQLDQFNHVLPDLKFFGLVAVMMTVILAVVYFWDASSGIVLTTGEKIYDLLNLN